MFRILLAGKPDFTGPVVTSSASVSVQESLRLSFSITTNELSTLAIGGADASKVELVSDGFATTHTLRWLHDGVQDYESPADANADNVYAITVTGTDLYSNVGSAQNLNITVTNLVTEDANWTSVVLLLGYEGTNGSAITTISDESLARHGSPTQGGTISTVHFKYGSTAASYTGTPSIFQDSDDWWFGTGNFTVETWVYLGNVSSQQIVLGQWTGGLSGSGNNLGWVLFVDGTLLKWVVSTVGNNALLDLSGGTITANAWHHVAVDFDGTKYRLYLDGVKVASSTTLRSYFNSSLSLGLGGRSDLSGNMLNGGYLDETRITKGVARYATDTSFTAPTAAFPRGGGSAWYDPWQVIFTETLTDDVGLPQATFRQIVPGSYLASTVSDVLRLKLCGGSSFYISLTSLYIGEQADVGNVYDFKTSPTQIYVQGASAILVPQNVTVLTDAIPFHIDPTKNYIISGDALVGVGAVARANLSVPGAVLFYSIGQGFEAGSTVSVLPGYAETDNCLALALEWQNYIGAYNLTLHPPLFVDSDVIYAPHRVTNDPLWSNVVFLTGYEGTNLSTTVTDESSSLHGTGTVSGAGTIVTAVKKYDTSSFSFDGSTSISWPDSADWNFGSGAFTVATWFRISAASGAQLLVGQWPNGTDLGWVLYTNGSALAFNISTTGNDNIALLSGGSVSTGAFHHAQVDFDGTKYRLYLDGVMVASSTTLRTIHDSAGSMVLGGVTAMFLTGYLDETEILKGAARWGSDTSFTPPTAAYVRN